MFVADWTQIMTAEKAEAELKNKKVQFKFEGPGWYFTDTDTVLAVPHQRTEKVWAKKFEPNEEFTFYVWNDSQAIHLLSELINTAPCRVDDRT